MIEISDKSKCSGCTACFAACPKQCIEMKADNEGFLYPVADKESCVECGACEHVCPVLNRVREVEKPQKAYLMQHKDEAVRMDSSSGGAFTAIAAWVIEKGGVVYGAAYDEDFQVHHTYAEDAAELWRFRNSKYVQSRMGESFKEAKDFLQEGRWVCFSGTPCQIEGLSKYLKKPYEKLVLVDVVCHGIPSPLVWNKYLEYQGAEQNRPDNIRFRDKFYGYKYSTMSIIRDGKNVYHAGAQMDPMLRAFFSDMSDRPICYACPFKKRYRVSDMTIWDCFSVYDFDKSMDDDKGTTRVLCQTEKGRNIAEQLSDIAVIKEVQPDAIVKGVREMTVSVKKNPGRDEFFEDAQVMTGAELFGKYYPITTMIKLKTAVRKALVTTGAYGVVKKGLNKIKGR